MSETKVISLPDRFDFGYNKAFSEQYRTIFASTTKISKIVLDFQRVIYLDSSALGMMVLLQKKAKERNITTSIRGAKNAAEDILKIANFQKLYSFE